MKNNFINSVMIFFVTCSAYSAELDMNKFLPREVLDKIQIRNSGTNVGSQFQIVKLYGDINFSPEPVKGKIGETQFISGLYPNGDGKTFNSLQVSVGECPKNKSFQCIGNYFASVNPVESKYRLIRNNTKNPQNSTITTCEPVLDNGIIQSPELKNCMTLSRDTCNEFLDGKYRDLSSSLGESELLNEIKKCEDLSKQILSARSYLINRFRNSQQYIQGDLTGHFDINALNSDNSMKIVREAKVTSIANSDNNKSLGSLVKDLNQVKAECEQARQIGIFKSTEERAKELADLKTYLKSITNSSRNSFEKDPGLKINGTRSGVSNKR